MEFPPHVRAFLESHDTLTLATAASDGSPQAAAVFYVLGRTDRLFFLSSQDSRHSRNIARDQRVAATVQADGQSWQSIQGVQLEGTARLLDGASEIATASAAYLNRFDFLLEFKDLLQATRSSRKDWTGIRRALADSRLYELRPSWMRIIDNAQGFGHKEEYRGDDD